MGVRFRDDVIESLRLAIRTDWWVGVDLLAGVAGFVVWVAGSGALGMQLASLADYPVATGGTPTMPVLALAGLLWLVLPAALGVARVRSRLLNIRNNVEQHYRLDRPAALLVPPWLLLVVLFGAGAAMGTVDPLLFVALVPATLYLLVRTTAYSYRVFAFSHPLVLYATLFLTLVVQAGVLLLYLGIATENEAIALASVDAIGLPVDPLATVGVAVLTVPTGLAATVALPAGLALAYVAVQFAAVLVVRLRDPTVRPDQVRTGQRYPPWLDVTSSERQSTSSAPASSSNTTSSDSTSSSASSAQSTGSSTASTGSAAANGGDGSGGTTSDPARAAASGSPDADANDGTATDTSAGAENTTRDGETADAEADSVRNTRVFTPPDGGGDDPLSSVEDGGDTCPECGVAVAADADECPACGADTT